MANLVFALAANPYRNSRAVRQIRLLSELGHTVHVLALDDTRSDLVFPDSVQVQAIPIQSPGGPSMFREISRQFFRAARLREATHFHASDLYVLGAMAKAAKTRRDATYSYDARECYPHVASTVGRPWTGWYWRLVEGRYIKGARYVFTVSGSIADHMGSAVWNSEAARRLQRA